MSFAVMKTIVHHCRGQRHRDQHSGLICVHGEAPRMATVMTSTSVEVGNQVWLMKEHITHVFEATKPCVTLVIGLFTSLIGFEQYSCFTSNVAVVSVLLHLQR